MQKRTPHFLRLQHDDTNEGSDAKCDRSESKKFQENTNWKVVSEIVKIDASPWLTIYGERIQDTDRMQMLDYWRVTKDHSAVIVTIHRNQFIFPKPVYRVGVDEITLDFPGGRIPPGKEPMDVVPTILERELGIDSDDLHQVKTLNEKGWAINSSFNNQKLYGFVAHVKDDVDLDVALLYNRTVNVNDEKEIQKLLSEDLLCLQCRALLREWQLTSN